MTPFLSHNGAFWVCAFSFIQVTGELPSILNGTVLPSILLHLLLDMIFSTLHSIGMLLYVVFFAIVCAREFHLVLIVEELHQTNNVVRFNPSIAYLSWVS